MAYTPKTIHSGQESGGYSTKNAQDLATVLEAMDTAIGAAGDVTAAAAITSSALTGTLTGTLDNTLADVGGSFDATAIATINKNFKEFQDELSKVRTDIASVRTAVNALITALA